jgi:hypothetical protein
VESGGPGGAAAEQLSHAGEGEGFHVVAERAVKDAAVAELKDEGDGFIFARDLGASGGEDLDGGVAGEARVELVVGFERNQAVGNRV